MINFPANIANFSCNTVLNVITIILIYCNCQTIRFISFKLPVIKYAQEIISQYHKQVKDRHGHQNTLNINLLRKRSIAPSLYIFCCS